MKTKNLLLILCFLFTIVTAKSQNFATDKGAIWVGGNASFTTSGGDLFEDYDENRSTCITFAPTVNYFVVPNIFVGGGIEISTDKQGDYKDSGFGIGPQAGYVFANESSTSFPFVSAGLRYYGYNSDYGDYGDSKSSGTDIFIGGGIVVPVAKHVGFTFEGGYHMIKLKEKDHDNSHSGNIFSISIGIAGLLYNPQ